LQGVESVFKMKKNLNSQQMSEMLRDSFISISRKRKNGPAVQKFREIVAKNFLSVTLEKLEILSF
jgi:hypothetical protein